MVKFAHIFNYSDLIGFTIFKCGIPIQPGRFGGHERWVDFLGFTGACAACGGE